MFPPGPGHPARVSCAGWLGQGREAALVPEGTPKGKKGEASSGKV